MLSKQCVGGSAHYIMQLVKWELPFPQGSAMCSLLPVLLLLCFSAAAARENDEEATQYCIIGAGPGGLQLGYFLHRESRDYIIFEKGSSAGTFFLQYPRHRTLISINKRFTGSLNHEFSFRHDWNSLISDDESLMVKHYSQDFFPKANDYLRYLQDYADRLSLRVKYHTEIVQVGREGKLFSLKDQNGTTHSCQVVVVSTGVWVPNIPSSIPGIELAQGYESVSIDPKDFEGKLVLILGRGNAGFETADNIVGSTAFIHMASRSRIKMSYQTHYVGDLRAINNNLVDTYQLKSLDGQFEADFAAIPGASIQLGEDGKFYLVAPSVPGFEMEENPLFSLGYDVVIRCLGFNFDFSIFNDSVRPPAANAGSNKYPSIKANYESVNAPGMFFAGTATHSLDYKISAGGFIHGFRYTVRALFHHLQWRYHHIPWPSLTLPTADLFNHLLKRINEASGPYQMFGVLVDVILIRDQYTVVYLEEVPLQAFPMFEEMTGHNIGEFMFWNFQYGENYSGPGKDTLSEDRVSGDALESDKSNFLHPVLYYYKEPPSPASHWVSGSLPQPDLYHHIVEDFLTNWTLRRPHQLPLRRFLEAVFAADLREFFAENCFKLILTYGNDIPLSCKQHFLQGTGISSSDGSVDFGSSDSFEL